jgi:16S rRNA (guanine527-N7)-methyltransferase
VVRARAEEGIGRGPVDVVSARAVAPLDRLAGWAIPLLRPGGRLLALKGASADQEVASASAALERAGVVQREVIPVSAAGSATVLVRLTLAESSVRQQVRR